MTPTTSRSSGACDAPNESADITQTTPTIATTASAGGAVGTVLTDQATLSGGTAPTGTITFVLYGPNDATCTTAVFTSNAIAVNGNGTYTSAPGFAPVAAGTYRWRAFYSGDANNNRGLRGMRRAERKRRHHAGADDADDRDRGLGRRRDRHGADRPGDVGGRYGADRDASRSCCTVPNDATCTTTVFTSNAIAVNGNGIYTSAPGFAPVAAGTYRWRAFYSGDANNNAVSGACGAPNESADIAQSRTVPDDRDRGLGRRPDRHGADRPGDVVGRYGADRHDHVPAVRSERCHLRDRDLHVESRLR